ncbi:hypothetical protein AB0323_10390 [Arthrobacter sp. NPDC080031]|uniref:hypothetical protein n=1 Tax=Arthrobacter sp. NPDC080031 TaxID=3155918 RepID=UPI00344F8107
MTKYPASLAAFSTASRLDAGPYSDDAEDARVPIVRERAVVSILAARFGRNRSSAIAASTRSRVSGRMLGELFNTRDTV